jgi:hypothetical protein
MMLGTILTVAYTAVLACVVWRTGYPLRPKGWRLERPRALRPIRHARPPQPFSHRQVVALEPQSSSSTLLQSIASGAAGKIQAPKNTIVFMRGPFLAHERDDRIFPQHWQSTHGAHSSAQLVSMHPAHAENSEIAQQVS